MNLGSQRLLMVGALILASAVFLLMSTLSTDDSDAVATEHILRGATSASTTLERSQRTSSFASEHPGLSIYNKSCTACHATGAAGAPKAGDGTAWGPRLAQEPERLVQAVIDGKGAMPPRGSCMACTDDDLKDATWYLLSLLDRAPGTAAYPDKIPNRNGRSGETRTAAE